MVDRIKISFDDSDPDSPWADHPWSVISFWSEWDDENFEETGLGNYGVQDLVRPQFPDVIFDSESGQFFAYARDKQTAIELAEALNAAAGTDYPIEVEEYRQQNLFGARTSAVYDETSPDGVEVYVDEIDEGTGWWYTVTKDGEELAGTVLKSDGDTEWDAIDIAGAVAENEFGDDWHRTDPPVTAANPIHGSPLVSASEEAWEEVSPGKFRLSHSDAWGNWTLWIQDHESVLDDAGYLYTGTPQAGMWHLSAWNMGQSTSISDAVFASFDEAAAGAERWINRGKGASRHRYAAVQWGPSEWADDGFSAYEGGVVADVYPTDANMGYDGEVWEWDVKATATKIEYPELWDFGSADSADEAKAQAEVALLKAVEHYKDSIGPADQSQWGDPREW